MASQGNNVNEDDNSEIVRTLIEENVLEMKFCESECGLINDIESFNRWAINRNCKTFQSFNYNYFYQGRMARKNSYESIDKCCLETNDNRNSMKAKVSNNSMINNIDSSISSVNNSHNFDDLLNEFSHGDDQNQNPENASLEFAENLFVNSDLSENLNQHFVKFKMAIDPIINIDMESTIDKFAECDADNYSKENNAKRKVSYSLDFLESINKEFESIILLEEVKLEHLYIGDIKYLILDNNNVIVYIPKLKFEVAFQINISDKRKARSLKQVKLHNTFKTSCQSNFRILPQKPFNLNKRNVLHHQMNTPRKQKPFRVPKLPRSQTFFHKANLFDTSRQIQIFNKNSIFDKYRLTTTEKFINHFKSIISCKKLNLTEDITTILGKDNVVDKSLPTSQPILKTVIPKEKQIRKYQNYNARRRNKLISLCEKALTKRNSINKMSFNASGDFHEIVKQIKKTESEIASTHTLFNLPKQLNSRIKNRINSRKLIF